MLSRSSFYEPVQTIDFSQWREVRQLQATSSTVWWVVVLINKSHGEHTQIQKTTEPEALLSRLPIRDADREWHAGIFIEVGPSARDADTFAQLVAGSFNGEQLRSRQIRGIISRTAMADRLAYHFRLRYFTSFENIFSIKDVEQRIQREPIEDE
jgi:hypothetical protein